MVKDNQKIIQGIITGDQQTISLFYREQIDYVSRYINANGGNTADAEDVFQDALVILYEKLNTEGYIIKASVHSFFFGVCKNIWRNRRRNSARHKVSNNDYHLEDTVEDVVLLDLDELARQNLYQKHFQKLSTEQKRLLSLFFDGKSMREISEITGRSEGATRKRKFYAKKKLLESIEQDPLYEELRVVC